MAVANTPLVQAIHSPTSSTARTHARTYARTHARTHTHTHTHTHKHTHIPVAVMTVWLFPRAYVFIETCSSDREWADSKNGEGVTT